MICRGRRFVEKRIDSYVYKLFNFFSSLYSPANKNMKATITAFVDVGFFKLHINKTQLIPDATIARKISTCVSNMKAENIENWLF